MIRKINLLRIIWAFSILLSCREIKQCHDVAAGSFIGNGIICYYRPESGGTYEMIFIPVCERKESLEKKIQNGVYDFKIAKGISFNIVSSDSLFQIIRSNSKLVSLRHRETVNKVMQKIYLCPVTVHLTNINNYTPFVTGNQDELTAKLRFENGDHLNVTYIFSNEVVVKQMEVLKHTNFVE